ncbi:MAG: nucleoside triphosphate pyrophosphohydrolase [Treponema sp.]|nr:nucleoside triphosphate pyrophosphohydrolase [Treponema sp.]
MTTSEAFKALYDTIAKLRSPEGCKWDREQTPSSIRGNLIEETYECIEAIDENDPAHITEELGDIYLVATMMAYMYEQEGKLTVTDALTKVNEKLIRRHPHVFGDIKVKDSAEILDNWAAIKIQEGRKPKDSILDEVSSGFPPMDRSYALQKKAAKVGFDWNDTGGVIAKIHEELDEVQEAVKSGSQIEEELGDLLFSVINLCRFVKVDPSVALHQTNTKFIKRFKYVETKMKETNNTMTKENLDIMEGFWNEAKGFASPS